MIRGGRTYRKKHVKIKKGLARRQERGREKWTVNRKEGERKVGVGRGKVDPRGQRSRNKREGATWERVVHASIYRRSIYTGMESKWEKKREIVL